MKGRNGQTWEHLWLTKTVNCMDALSMSAKQTSINMSKSFKSAGTDGIVPALLQQGTGHLADICAVYLQPV